MIELGSSPVPSVGPDEERSSYWRRRFARHVMIAFATGGCVAVFWKLFSARHDLISHVSIATAYPALVLTSVALVLGPWNVLAGRHNPVSFDLRRDLGIWAGVMALVHTAVGLDVHLRGRPWLYFVDERLRIRHPVSLVAGDL